MPVTIIAIQLLLFIFAFSNSETIVFLLLAFCKTSSFSIAPPYIKFKMHFICKANLHIRPKRVNKTLH